MKTFFRLTMIISLAACMGLGFYILFKIVSQKPVSKPVTGAIKALIPPGDSFTENLEQIPDNSVPELEKSRGQQEPANLIETDSQTRENPENADQQAAPSIDEKIAGEETPPDSPTQIFSVNQNPTGDSEPDGKGSDELTAAKALTILKALKTDGAE